MAFYKIKKVWKLKDNKVTPENFYNTRRDFLKKLGAGSLFLPGTSFISRPAFSSLYPPEVNKSYTISKPLTPESLATTYTNFYEFGSSKNIWRRASKLKVDYHLTECGALWEKDSVNVFDFPLAQVVTNINLQHKNFLKKKTLNEIIHQDVGFLNNFTKGLYRLPSI